MSDNVVYLHRRPREIARYMRVGFHEQAGANICRVPTSSGSGDR